MTTRTLLTLALALALCACTMGGVGNVGIPFAWIISLSACRCSGGGYVPNAWLAKSFAYAA